MVIAEHAVFDERYFSGNSPEAMRACPNQPPSPVVDSLPPAKQPVVRHAGGDEDEDSTVHRAPLLRQLNRHLLPIHLHHPHQFNQTYHQTPNHIHYHQHHRLLHHLLLELLHVADSMARPEIIISQVNGGRHNTESPLLPFSQTLMMTTTILLIL